MEPATKRSRASATLTLTLAKCLLSSTYIRFETNDVLLVTHNGHADIVHAIELMRLVPFILFLLEMCLRSACLSAKSSMCSNSNCGSNMSHMLDQSRQAPTEAISMGGHTYGSLLRGLFCLPPA